MSPSDFTFLPLFTQKLPDYCVLMETQVGAKRQTNHMDGFFECTHTRTHARTHTHAHTHAHTGVGLIAPLGYDTPLPKEKQPMRVANFLNYKFRSPTVFGLQVCVYTYIYGPCFV